MALDKYLSILHTRNLWFAAAIRLGDPWEGSVPSTNAAIWDHLIRIADGDDGGTAYAELIAESEGDAAGARIGELLALGPEVLQKMREQMKRASMAARNHTYVNCWHASGVESAAMWSQYSSSAGLAVVSTIDRLMESVKSDSRSIFVGQVTYADYSDITINSGNLLTPFLHKRQSFEHEREIRAIVSDIPERAGDSNDVDLAMPGSPGLQIDVDPDVLIAEVRVSPEAPTWLLDVVRKATEAAGFNFGIRQSAMSDSPIF